MAIGTDITFLNQKWGDNRNRKNYIMLSHHIIEAYLISACLYYNEAIVGMTIAAVHHVSDLFIFSSLISKTQYSNSVGYCLLQYLSLLI